MLANTPPDSLTTNVYDLPPVDVVSHATHILFGADSEQTQSTDVARHVIAALDQASYMPAADRVFGPFPVPRLLDASEQSVMDSYASTVNLEPLTKAIHVLQEPGSGRGARPLGDGAAKAFHCTLAIPTDRPASGTVKWFAVVFGPGGVTTNGVAVTPTSANGDTVTVTVDASVVGDVVIDAVYQTAANVTVYTDSFRVTSIDPAGATLTGIRIEPADLLLPMGTAITPIFVAIYSDGTRMAR